MSWNGAFVVEVWNGLDHEDSADEIVGAFETLANAVSYINGPEIEFSGAASRRDCVISHWIGARQVEVYDEQGRPFW